MFALQQITMPAAGRFPAHLFRRMRAAVRRLIREPANRRLEQHLSAMDDAMLRDLGIERQRIRDAVRSGRP